MSNIIDSIQLSGVTYTLQGSGGGTVSSAITSGDTNAVAGGAVYDKFDEVEQVTARALNDLDEKINPTVELTQAQYDALVSAGTVDPNTFYVITDAKPIETSGFVQTSAITSSVTSASTDSQIPTAKAVWEAASGGGSTYTAGRGIDITSDTISVSLPISAGTGSYSIQEGQNTKATGNYSHAEGQGTIAKGYRSHAEGDSTIANAGGSHAEGSGSIASGYYSHAEGNSTSATSDSSHAEGRDTIASGYYSHAEGWATTASGQSSHAEGESTVASGARSHAEGYGTKASGDSSHAEGNYTKTTNKYEHASGSYNNSVSASTTFGDSGNTLFSVGNGTSSSARHNAFEIRQNGDIYLSSGGTDIKLQDYLGGSSITIDPTLDSGSTNPVANSAITNALNNKQIYNSSGYFYDVMTSYKNKGGNNTDYIRFKAYKNDGSTTNVTKLYFPRINGNKLVNSIEYYTDFQLLEKSAITSAITSSSTDVQVPSAKAVYDAIPIVTNTITSGDTNAVAGGAVYDKFDEMEQVTAAGLNALNDKFGGLKLVKLTQAEYNALTTKDSSTLYIIVN